MPNSEIRNLLRNWLGHLVERIVRLHEYLAERSTNAPAGYSGPPPLTLELISGLTKLAEEVREKGRYLLRVEAQLTERYSTYYTFARTAAERFGRLHACVGFMPVPWPTPELQLFLRKVLAESHVHNTTLRTTGWTILLTGDFNFSHILLREEHARFFPRNVLTVPAAERDNPLFWPNLVHEISHGIAAEAGVLDQMRETQAIQTCEAGARRTLEAWGEEIVADLLATDILGPAYFGAFATFASYWIKSLRKGSEFHPSPTIRMKYIYGRLLEGYRRLRDVMLVQLHSEFEARLNLDYRDDDIRNEWFDETQSKSGKMTSYPADGLVEDFVDQILALDTYQAIGARALAESEVDIVQDLAIRIRKGELIASRRSPSAHIPPLKTEADVRANYAQALDQLTEVPNDVRLILNAAFIRKLSYAPSGKRLPAEDVELIGYYGGLLEQFADGHDAIDHKLFEMREAISDLDAIVSKSIQATEIVGFFRERE